MQQKKWGIGEQAISEKMQKQKLKITFKTKNKHIKSFILLK